MISSPSFGQEDEASTLPVRPQPKTVYCTSVEAFDQFAEKMHLRYVDLGTDSASGVTGRLLTNGKVSIVIDMQGGSVCMTGTYALDQGDPA